MCFAPFVRFVGASRAFCALFAALRLVAYGGSRRLSCGWDFAFACLAVAPIFRGQTREEEGDGVIRRVPGSLRLMGGKDKAVKEIPLSVREGKLDGAAAGDLLGR